MFSGVVSDDSLSNILRNISQRRRHGLLEVTLPDRKLKVIFVSGKIVEALEDEHNPVLEVAKMMQEAGLIAGELEGEIVSSYKSFFLALCENQPEHKMIEEELFRRIVRARILNKLYSLSGLEAGFYTFHNQMVDYDRDFAPNISVGQLLLDLVALQSDGEKFKETFPSECLIVAAEGDDSAGLSSDHTLIMRLAKHGATLADLERRSMLSRYHLQDGLMTLHSQGLVACQDRGALPQEIVGEQVIEGLKSSIDNAFQEMASNIAGMDLEKMIEGVPSSPSNGGDAPPPGSFAELAAREVLDGEENSTSDFNPKTDSTLHKIMDTSAELGRAIESDAALSPQVASMVESMSDSMMESMVKSISALTGSETEYNDDFSAEQPASEEEFGEPSPEEVAPPARKDSTASIKKFPTQSHTISAEELAARVTQGPVVAPPVPPPAVESRGSGRLKVQWSEGWKERRDNFKDFLALGADSHKLLNSRAITDGLVFAFLCLAVIVPMMAWAKIFRYFAY